MNDEFYSDIISKMKNELHVSFFTITQQLPLKSYLFQCTLEPYGKY